MKAIDIATEIINLIGDIDAEIAVLAFEEVSLTGYRDAVDTLTYHLIRTWEEAKALRDALGRVEKEIDNLRTKDKA